VNPEQEKEYLEKYKKAKASGYRFWPDVIYKDLLISFGIFILIILIATFIGVAAEPPADPSDTAYIPRPEWYFLFLFQMLKFFPGKLEWVGTFIIPTVAVLALILLPFIDRSPYRYWKKRKLAIGIMCIIVLGMAGLTIAAVVTTPPQEESVVATTLSDQIVAGQDLFSTNCVECHGADGEGGEIKGVEGLEGRVIKGINTADEMYTRTDDTLFNIIDYGQPDLGMPPFGLAHGGELSRGDIQSLVTFMRYTWDDRVEPPAEAAQAGAIPTLGPDQVPSYVENIEPIVKRYCVSCHREGKKNNNFLMGSYDQIMTTGDHAPNLVAGDLNSNLILMLERQKIEAGGPMPPTKPLNPDLIDIFKRWVMAGMPNTAQDAAALSTSIPQTTPQGPTSGTPTP
jgi:quinol---cytochrome c reductase cytochrome c subunit, bacillus type